MEKTKLVELISTTVKDLNHTGLKTTGKLYKGKVRDVFDLGDKLLLYTSDRISAFDKVLTTIPCKGEILNRISVYWFQKTASVMENHIIRQVSPRAVLVHKCEVIPLELIVRGYLTGSAWRDYRKSSTVSGIRLPGGMKYNQRFDTPLLTPTTKAAEGHDMPISAEEILARKLVSEELWKQIASSAMAMFTRASELAGKQGLILVDTKFEFGLHKGKLICADEIFTPDSSRFWFAETYEELFAQGVEQKRFDKEYLRKWLMDRNFMGEGEIPFIPPDIRAEVALRYIEAFEKITGQTFTATPLTPSEELEQINTALAGL